MSKHANRPHRPGCKEGGRPGWAIKTKDGVFRTTAMPTRKAKDGTTEKVPGMFRYE